ncbi:hypothetical protein EPI10_015040 [Gossypium australe]|uniref:Reverse transcriptase zinc-binding domain-containing protein n=1 Tax=Gossypium australe TaxID=47621 RepID=A0A5B6VJ79_9ROSI|nr:hypothetical protein EPI10_015040 [Gossypium australe]
MPTLGNLKARGLIENAFCPVCKEEEETMTHLFRDCYFIKLVLQKLMITPSTINKEQRMLNDCYCFLGAMVARFINAYKLELEQIANLPKVTQETQNERWRPSNNGMVKANFDTEDTISMSK